MYHPADGDEALQLVRKLANNPELKTIHRQRASTLISDTSNPDQQD